MLKLDLHLVVREAKIADHFYVFSNCAIEKPWKCINLIEIVINFCAASHFFC